MTSIVLAHDYLTQRGGAERVALEIAKQFDVEKVITSSYVPTQTFAGFSSFDIQVSRDPVLRLLKRDPRRALPVLARVWDSFPAVKADVVICSSSGWSHAIPVAPRTKKVVYCHNPARWLYQPEDFLIDSSIVARFGLSLLRERLTRWDKQSAARADAYVANSTSVARRIQEAYGIRAQVVFPPVSVDTMGFRERPAGVEPGYFLCVSRPRAYKGIDKIVQAMRGLPDQRLVVVGRDSSDVTPDNVLNMGRVSESQLRWLYENARALISVSHEDFGLTPVEANSFGTPSLLLRAGGFLDSTAEGVSGLFIADESVEAIRHAIMCFPDAWNQSRIVDHAANFSPARFAQNMRDVIAGLGDE